MAAGIVASGFGRDRSLINVVSSRGVCVCACAYDPLLYERCIVFVEPRNIWVLQISADQGARRFQDKRSLPTEPDQLGNTHPRYAEPPQRLTGRLGNTPSSYFLTLPEIRRSPSSLRSDPSTREIGHVSLIPRSPSLHLARTNSRARTFVIATTRQRK